MKKLIHTLVLAMIAGAITAQSWNIGLNSIGGGNSNFGTSNNFPINFYTNNTQRMVLNTSGVLKVNGLGGSGNRILSTNNNGEIGSFAYLLINGSNHLYTPPGLRFGIGNDVPATSLDVSGGGRVSDDFGAKNAIYIGDENDYGLIRYYPPAGSSPAVLSFGMGGVDNVKNPSPGTAFNARSWSLSGATNDDNMTGAMAPGWNGVCNGGVAAGIGVVATFTDAISSKNGSHGRLNFGHKMAHAFIESISLDPGDVHKGDLYINECNNENVYVFGHNPSFAHTSMAVMSVNGSFNVHAKMQVGDNTSADFKEPSSVMYVSAQQGVGNNGLKIKHGELGSFGAKIIEFDNNEYAFGVFKGDAMNDGDERFTILGDGRTTITSINPVAFDVADATNGNFVHYYVNNYGAVGQLQIANTTKAQRVTNTNNDETFALYGNGYMEINVRNNGMPVPPGGTNSRVFTICDKSNVSPSLHKDLFAVMADGKVFAREVEISNVPYFPDYVFNSDYKLSPLAEVESYIHKHKHLPGFEKGEYYEKNGIQVSDLILKQQEKIEELTLYVIALEKQLKENRSGELAEQLKNLEARLLAVEKK